MASPLNELWYREDGQDVTEYALLIAVIALAAIGFLSDITGGLTALRNNAFYYLGIANTTAST